MQEEIANVAAKLGTRRIAAAAAAGVVHTLVTGRVYECLSGRESEENKKRSKVTQNKRKIIQGQKETEKEQKRGKE